MRGKRDGGEGDGGGGKDGGEGGGKEEGEWRGMYEKMVRYQPSVH